MSDEMYVAIQNPGLSSGADFSLKKDFVAADPIPEPASVVLLATGLMGLTDGGPREGAQLTEV